MPRKTAKPLSPAEALKKFVTNSDGSPKRGALARVAEYLNVKKPTLKNWMTGAWEPGKSTGMGERILAMIEQGISLKPNYQNCGRKKRIPRTD